MQLSCGRDSVGTLGWETHVLDADGVKSQPVPHTVRCVPDAAGPDRNGLPENTAAAGMSKGRRFRVGFSESSMARLYRA